MKRWLLIIPTAAGFACGPAVGSVYDAADGGTSGADSAVVTHDDAQTGSDAAPIDSGSDSAPSTAHAITAEALTYKTTPSVAIDISFSLTGSQDVKSLTEISLSFAGASMVYSFPAACDSQPWRAPVTAQARLRIDADTLDTLYYPCGGFGVGVKGPVVSYSGAGDLTVTFKGLLQDNSPWTVSVTGSKI